MPVRARGPFEEVTLLSLRPHAFVVVVCFCALTVSGTWAASDAPRDAGQPSPTRASLSRLGLSEMPFGTPLSDFKHTHRRTASGGRIAPYCSDDYPDGDYVRSSVPGIAFYNCRLHLPEEQMAPDYRPPRVLAFETLRVWESPVGYDLIFRFLPVDAVARLWRVEAVFSLRHWRAATTGLERELGPPAQQHEGPAGTYGAPSEVVRRVWKAGGTTFTLHRYFGDYLTSALVAEDDELETVFRRRLERARRAGDSAL